MPPIFQSGGIKRMDAELKNKIGTNCDVNTKLGHDKGGVVLRDCKIGVFAIL